MHLGTQDYTFLPLWASFWMCLEWISCMNNSMIIYHCLHLMAYQCNLEKESLKMPIITAQEYKQWNVEVPQEINQYLTYSCVILNCEKIKYFNIKIKEKVIENDLKALSGIMLLLWISAVYCSSVLHLSIYCHVECLYQSTFLLLTYSLELRTGRCPAEYIAWNCVRG